MLELMLACVKWTNDKWQFTWISYMFVCVLLNVEDYYLAQFEFLPDQNSEYHHTILQTITHPWSMANNSIFSHQTSPLSKSVVEKVFENALSAKFKGKVMFETTPRKEPGESREKEKRDHQHNKSWLRKNKFQICSHKQGTVAQTTVVVEYMAAAIVAKQATWMRKVPLHFGMPQTKPTELFVDNKSIITIAKNPVFYKKTKHINVKYYLSSDAEKCGEVLIPHFSFEEQFTDMLAKSLSKPKFNYHKDQLKILHTSIKGECWS
ncbi:Uncharacterized protein TCM_032441 [Theobroma cacao]|uniref:Cysteine-rich RLK (RECEPTOR-like protein kinase) 8 n=1 Tax=Theobroma cacao TaxID=3641 RepID=A0A061F8Y3_THECC|nr:Uncharacterized protein TCM_032441 [Theobroma cacao]